MKKIFTPFCLIIVLNICKPSVINAQVDVNDSLALVDLYNSTNGRHWKDGFHWLLSNPVKSWYGVTVENNRVTAVTLEYKNLSGSIPESIGNLTRLRFLFLTGNRLTGSIPKSLDSLDNLYS